jgi:hypothetical protein
VIGPVEIRNVVGEAVGADMVISISIYHKKDKFIYK